MKKERCTLLSFSLKEKVVAERPDEVLRDIVNPSSPCFAGTFSLREKDDKVTPLAPPSTSPNIPAAF